MEEEYLDVLKNIEMAILSIYRQQPELTDYNVDSALESLGRTYQREKTGGAAILPKNNLAMQVYGAVKTMCEWRMGRANLVDEEGQPMNAGDKSLSINEILACLKKIRKSVNYWNKESGTRGYLGYISRFLV
jgi:hypothetical protein